MKWRAPSERAQFILLSPVIVPVAVLSAPVLLVMAGSIWLQDRIARAIRPGKAFTPWFAWRPIRINDWFDPNEGQWFWLEQVERRWARSYIEYRTAQVDRSPEGGDGTAPFTRATVPEGDAPNTAAPLTTKDLPHD